MSKKGGDQSIILWDSFSCESKNVDFISKIVKNLKVNITSIVVYSKDQNKFCPSISDLSTVYPVVIRFGENAVLDTIVDVVGFLSKCKNNCTFILITNNFPLWINLFQRSSPRSVVFISSTDPRVSLDYSFLPPSIKLNILKWPDLTELLSQPASLVQRPSPPQSPPPPSLSQEQPDAEEENENEPEEEIAAEQNEENEQGYEEDNASNYVHEEPSDNADDEEEDDHADISSSLQREARIQPLDNIDKYQNTIDLRSPSVTGTPSRRINESPEITPKRQQISNGQKMEIPTKFRPLIEAMKSIGKAMISLNDLEGQLNAWFNKLNEPAENINSYIAKASDAGIIIYDKSINYVRFRNRSTASAQIEYV
ncbi:hypothetical protein M9Y10_028525 [Tritrichomonas musculus]|uniref:NYN domain-containing protein n=1 Tax=Tritrichomonas musculus TaxID=1915356 RepID=A0ABR2KLL1_9EUKA